MNNILNKIEIEIPGYGKRYCSNNVQYSLKKDCFIFFYFNENDSRIHHNEYGPAQEWKDGSYEYCINHKFHRLDGPAFYDAKFNLKRYFINGEYIGRTEEEFIQYKNQYLLVIK